MKIDSLNLTTSKEIKKLNTKMTTEFTVLRKDMGRIYESGKRADLAASGRYSPDFLKQINVKSIMDLVALLPSSTGLEESMTSSEQRAIAFKLAKTIMVRDSFHTYSTAYFLIYNSNDAIRNIL